MAVLPFLSGIGLALPLLTVAMTSSAAKSSSASLLPVAAAIAAVYFSLHVFVECLGFLHSSV